MGGAEGCVWKIDWVVLNSQTRINYTRGPLNSCEIWIWTIRKQLEFTWTGYYLLQKLCAWAWLLIYPIVFQSCPLKRKGQLKSMERLWNKGSGIFQFTFLWQILLQVQEGKVRRDIVAWKKGSHCELPTAGLAAFIHTSFHQLNSNDL